MEEDYGLDEIDEFHASKDHIQIHSDDEDSEIDEEVLKLGMYSDDSEEDEEDNSDDEHEIEAVGKRWGQQRNNFHGADDDMFAEDGQDDAELVEAINMRKQQADDMSDSDFDISDDDEESEEDNEAVNMTVEKSLAKEDKLHALQTQAPELVGILAELRNNLACFGDIEGLVNILKSSANRVNQKYGETKIALMNSYVMNILFYLVLKAKGREVKDHPVIKKLMQLRMLIERLAAVDDDLSDDMERLVNLAEEVTLNEPTPEEIEEAKKAKKAAKKEKKKAKKAAKKAKKLAKKEAKKRAKLGIKEVKTITEEEMERLRAEEEDFLMGQPSRKRRRVEALDDTEFDADIKATVHTVGGDAYDEEEGNDDDMSFDKSEMEKMVAMMGEDGDLGGVDWDVFEEATKDDAANALLRTVQEAKNEKVEMANAFKYEAPLPSIDATVDEEERRGASKKIMKNKGIVRYKPAKDRNPRVRKRVQHDKAVKRRRGQVRDIRKGEMNVYGGEATGINVNTIKSRNLSYSG
eukprot:TRINITY_DN13857_c0_g1_i1.p1 TRINITY_DN13857_c0_g1~~TRINITY_DN13857_c0_g1_i1.p1  ORF type:complete len:522 (-),score=269.08 TRINITY_DN13857_c0_g1_i1:175-1740(-)